jgi:hypothetical protein
VSNFPDPQHLTNPEHIASPEVLPNNMSGAFTASVSPESDGRVDQVETESVTEPAKVMRIGSMVKQLLDEVRGTTLDEPSRERLAEIYDRSIVEISEAVSPDLAEELKMLALPFREGEVPSESELRVAKAQLVGWLEGLFHGIQATLFAQQLAARQQLEQMRQIQAPQRPGQTGQGGTYL